MQTQTKILIAAAATVGVVVVAASSSGAKRKSKTDEGKQSSSGGGTSGGQPVDPTLSYAEQRRICRKLRRLGAKVHWGAAKRRCVRDAEPEPTPPPKPNTPPPAPNSPAAQALCTAPEYMSPEHVGTLLATVAWPAYKKVVGDEIAPSAGMHAGAIAEAKKAIKAMCKGAGAGVDAVADDFARAAAAVEAGSRYGAPIETSTAIGRLCLYNGGSDGHLPLDTSQVLCLIVDVAIDGLRRNWSQSTIVGKLTDCDHPVSPTTAIAIATSLAGAAAVVRKEMGL